MEFKYLEKESLIKKIALVVGTRPGIIMFSPIIRSCIKKKIDFIIIHSGQHYSPNMDSIFFQELDLPKPDFQLSGISEKKFHGAQTAAMLEGIERILIKERPSMVLVGGDANTNLAGALAARKLHINIGHVEAGERSFDWRMPEEHNRKIIDHISDVLFTTGQKSEKHLLNENVQGKIYITGNTIVDASIQNLKVAQEKSNIVQVLRLKEQNYCVLTIHREENVDEKKSLKNILSGVCKAAVEINKDVIFPVHPRTKKRLSEFNLDEWAKTLPKMNFHDALGYLDFLSLISKSSLVFTDSGGVQQEACIHRVPTVTIRENTEWVETLETGANRLSGSDENLIIKSANEAINIKRNWDIPFGDGEAANKIVEICKSYI